MATTNVNEWAGQVIAALRTPERNQLFQEAIDLCHDESGEDTPEDGLALLEWMRGDEPQDCFDNDESAQEYADFLYEEWELFGPQGE